MLKIINRLLRKNKRIVNVYIQLSLSILYIIKSTWIWDTFAEPNIYTIPSQVLGQNQASPALAWASPKKQDNSRRLRSMDNSKLVFSEVQKHLSKSSGFFFFMRVVSLLLLIFISGELIAQTDQQLLAFEK